MGPGSGPVPPAVSVAWVRPVDHTLYEIGVRVSTGRLLRMIIAQDQATTGNVFMAAQALDILERTHRIPD